MKRNSLTRLMRDAQARAIIELATTARIAAIVQPPFVCILCRHESGQDIPNGSHGICDAHRAQMGTTGLRGMLVAALDEMDETENEVA